MNNALSTCKEIFINTPREIALCFNRNAGRSLTPGEIELAQSVFGNTINYTSVRIIDSFLHSMSASTLGNQVYLTDFITDRDDISKSKSIFNKRTLIHELTHIWQSQNKKMPGILPLMFLRLRSSLLDQDIYAYDIEQKNDFLDFNIEQQATIVENLFVARECGKDRPNTDCHISIDGGPVVQIDEYIESHRQKTSPYFPNF